VRGAGEAIAALPADVEGAKGKHVVCRCMDVTRKKNPRDMSFDQLDSPDRMAERSRAH
jgi:hypothetical protein